jgi:hypothetical protein
MSNELPKTIFEAIEKVKDLKKLEHLLDEEQSRFLREKIDGQREFYKFINNNDGAALIKAINDGNNDLVELLLKYGANVRINFHPLFHAVKSNNVKVVETILKKGAKTFLDQVPRDYLPVQCCSNLVNIAVAANNYELTKLLLENDAYPAYTLNGKLPIHEAVKNNNLDLVKLLRKFRASPNVFDEDYKTPLHYALLNESKDMIKFLIDSGANPNENPNIFLKKHESPLEMAEKMGDEWVILLIGEKKFKQKQEDREKWEKWEKEKEELKKKRKQEEDELEQRIKEERRKYEEYELKIQKQREKERAEMEENVQKEIQRERDQIRKMKESFGGKSNKKPKRKTKRLRKSLRKRR